MMKTTLPYAPAYCRFYLRIMTFLAFLLPSVAGQSQNFKGKDGNESYTITGSYILNRYTALSGPAMAGALSITVNDINELSGAYSFTNSVNPYATSALSRGDLVMIIQMQGANITTTDDAAYGAVTDYNNTGQYEVRVVNGVSGNTIFLCGNLQNSYYQQDRSRTQVVRIPRVTTLAMSSGTIITGMPWDGAKGGVVAIEADQQVIINGRISADTIGFRGGTDDINNSSSSGAAVVSLYRTTVTTTTAGKGESIAGNANDYHTYLNGANGRGAPANGGGGGNGHNSGGGGGSNAGTNGVLATWNGSGIKDVSGTSWSVAWNLESAGFATNVSTGGGRGGYSFSNTNQDAITLAPGSNAWGGDKRQIVGGLGGRPLDYSSALLFMGGGGGAGDGNNQSAGNGGNGGGIVYLLTNGDVSGTGTISANGQNGYNTKSSHIDAAGGAGGGGAIAIMAEGNITGITIQANGGKGGDQQYLTGEAEGPGGGGGGGYITTTATGVARQVAGGANGISNSTMVSEFLPNGATGGAAGTIASQTFRDYFMCDENGIVLPVKLSGFEAIGKGQEVLLQWQTASEYGADYFEVERSTDGIHFNRVGTEKAQGYSNTLTRYTHTDVIAGLQAKSFYYRLKMVDRDGKYTYSLVRKVEGQQEMAGAELNAYPNPVVNNMRINLPANWQGKRVSVEVYDMTGKLAARFEKNSAGLTEQVGLQQLGNGVYLVQATMDNETARQRIVKR